MGAPARLIVGSVMGALVATGAVVVPPAAPATAAVTISAAAQPVESETTDVPLSVEAPVIAPPVDAPPAEEPPTEEPPVEEPSVEESPTGDAPTEEAPADGAPTDAQPTEETPSGDAPSDAAPTEEPPAVQAPSADAPSPTPSGPQASPFSLQSVPVVLSAESDASGFAVVGVVWDAADDAAVTTVEVRSLAADTWTEWEEIPQEESEKDDSAAAGVSVVGTDPIVVGDVDRVEVRMTATSVPAGATLSVIDPGASAADASPTAVASITAAGGPAILPRSAWGADESMMTWTPSQGRVTGAVIHHTAGTNNYSPEQVPAILRGIYAFHSQTKGWGDIGYNFLVDKYGRTWEGRSGGTTLATVGAHAVNYNSAMTGVSVMGDYTSTGISQAAWDAVVDVTAWKLAIHGVRVTDSTSVNGGTYPAVVGHRDVGQTSCPGQQIYGRLGELRNAMSARQGAYQSVFGSALNNFVKTATSSTVYLVVNRTRHPVPDQATLTAFASLGGISVVSQSYLGAMSQGKPLGRLVRSSSSGEVSFVDASIRLRLPTCTMASDYGSSCDAAVNLTAGQLQRLSAGPQMTNGYETTNGKRFYVSKGTRREVFDTAALTAARLPTSSVRLTETGISRLPYGAPVLRPDVVVQDRASGQNYAFSGSTMVPTAASVVTQTALKRHPRAKMDAGSIRKLTQGAPMYGYVRPSTGTARYLLTDAGLVDVTGMKNMTTATFVPMSATWLATFSKVSTTQPLFVRAWSSDRVYFRQKTTLRAVLAAPDMAALAAPQAVRVRVVADASVSRLPTGSAIPSPGSLVKSKSSAAVFLVDGFSQRVPLEVFDVSVALGLGTSVTTLTDASIASLPVARSSLSPFVTCDGTAKVGVSGRLRPHTVGSAAGTGFPTTALKGLTCGRMPSLSTVVRGAVFVKSTTSSTVYHVVGGRKRAMSSWAQLTSTAGTANPVIHVLGPKAVAAMP